MSCVTHFLIFTFFHVLVASVWNQPIKLPFLCTVIWHSELASNQVNMVVHLVHCEKLLSVTNYYSDKTGILEKILIPVSILETFQILTLNWKAYMPKMDNWNVYIYAICHLGVFTMLLLGHRNNVICLLPLLIKGKTINHILHTLGYGDTNADKV
jgi:hypothetical protein